ncbi:DUF5317 family protein [Nonomuraea rubra]
MILLMAAPVLLGAALGYLFGGRLHHLADLRLKALPLLLAAALLQAAQFAGVTLFGLSLIGPVFVLVGVWGLLNLRDPGCPVRPPLAVILAGGAMNGLAILVNGRMPFAGTSGETPKHEVMDAATRLPWLGDVIPVPGTHLLISVGDLLLVAGIGWLIAAGMRAPRTV